MPRAEINNPTSRILRILAEVEVLEAVYSEMSELIASNPDKTCEWLFQQLSPTPALVAIAEERLRQNLMGRRVVSNKLGMRRNRLRTAPVRASTLTQEQMDDIQKEIDELPTDKDLDIS